MAFSVSESSFFPISGSCTYHVFLSFRGEDIGHLYAALKMKGIRIYRGNMNLEIGDVLSRALLKGTEESMFAVTVLSPNYASSAWCLEELTKIVECIKNKGLEVVPVFYDVNPSDVRYQKGRYGGAFRKLEERFGEDSERVKRWRNALTYIAGYSGLVCKDRHDERNIESITGFIQRKLLSRIGFYSLMPTEKNIFLDIACFFKGMERDKVTQLLKVCFQYDGIGSGLDTLIDKFLVTLDQNSKLEMHPLIQDLGRLVVYEESPHMEDIKFMFRQNEGSNNIQGIGLSQDYALYEADWKNDVFSKTRWVKLLQLYGLELPNGLKCLPNSLKYLHWTSCPLETLPLPSERYEFFAIDLPYSKIIQLWHGTKKLENLKYLNLSHCWYLKQTPDLSEAPVLETFILEECLDLTKVHPSLVRHKNLVLLNLSKCTSLKTLPGTLEMGSLKELLLTDCWSFENLPEFGQGMKNLSRLCLEGTAIRKLPTSLGTLFGLSDSSLDTCKTFSFENN